MPNSTLVRDGFECALTKETASDYWKTTVKDIYVRNSAGGAENAPADDYNNAIANDGKDWIVYTEDKDRAEGDNLCTASNETDIKCSKIKCVVRRQLQNQDPDDMQFKPDDAAVNKMTFEVKKSWIMLNWTTLATANRKMLEV